MFTTLLLLASVVFFLVLAHKRTLRKQAAHNRELLDEINRSRSRDRYYD